MDETPRLSSKTTFSPGKWAVLLSGSVWIGIFLAARLSLLRDAGALAVDVWVVVTVLALVLAAGCAIAELLREERRWGWAIAGFLLSGLPVLLVVAAYFLMPD